MSDVVTRCDGPPKRELPITLILPPTSLIRYRARFELEFVPDSKRSSRELCVSVSAKRSSTSSLDPLLRFTVINAASPGATDPLQLPGASSKVACSEVSLGSTSGSGDPAGRTTKDTSPDCPPSAAGLTTVTRLVAGDAVSAAVRNTTNCLSLMN